MKYILCSWEASDKNVNAALTHQKEMDTVPRREKNPSKSSTFVSRWAIYPPIHPPSILPSICPTIYPFILPSFSIYSSICLPSSFLKHSFTYPLIYPSIHPYFYFHPSIDASSPTINLAPTIHPPIYLHHPSILPSPYAQSSITHSSINPSHHTFIHPPSIHHPL